MKVEIWSDIVCPWCYIGKRRFEAALDDFDGEVEVVWRSFELDPGAPKEQRGPLDAALAKKYGMSLERAKEMVAHMTGVAAEEGLDFRFDQAKGGNTFDAHRLLHLAKAEGKGPELKERLLRAYFTEGRSIVEPDELVALAAEVGVDEAQARRVVEGTEYGAEVRQDQARAMEIGVRGVPFFVVAERYGVSGAQPTEAFLEVLEKAKAELKPALQHVGDPQTGEACGPEGCAVPERGDAP